jgi:hypothetical protein
VIDGILHRVRTGVQWRDLPERFGRGRPSMNATGCGPRTKRGSACSSRSRPRSTGPVRSTGTSRSTPPSSALTSMRPALGPTRPRHPRQRGTAQAEDQENRSRTASSVGAV